MKYKTDWLVEELATINDSTQAAITTGTCVALLFDDRKDTRLSATPAAAQTILSVEHTQGKNHAFVVGDALYIELDDGTYHTSDIVSIDHAAGTITITAGLTSPTTLGASVHVLLGAPITMAAFGTPESPPSPTSTFWGWRGTIPDTQADIEIGQNIRIQIELDGGAGLKLRDRVFETVEGWS